ncbi:MAG: inorganic phosphate transporter [Candidatus Marinimicrobia bacterium]|nr:inorganic phosphate transporter [Candidatus Neomarinimicrobiota bacterium]
MTAYLIMIIILFFLAVSGLVVGVTNDAVNFLNSARGAKAARNWIILVIASLGILIGTTFSSGMMEVARKGVFHPQQFSYAEVMIIYMAVMLTNVILLDAYNTLALPTSTTVSIVFSLLGAALAVSILKVIRTPGESIGQLSEYINSDKALAIIAGILLSVLIAFLAGSIVQFLTRLLFTFQYNKQLSRYGAVWGGICISLITYFILIKGADGASFMTESLKSAIVRNTSEILLLSFIGWTLLIQLLRWVFKISIPRLIILIGTFSLAFAFAGNDLVNFIGVPLAGYHAFRVFAAVPGADPATFSMKFMTGSIQTETYLLLISGAVMILTLWFSKKSRHVSQTELSIARQDIGEERFASTGVSRAIVYAVVVVNEFFNKLIPEKAREFFDKRFANTLPGSGDEARSFDMIRASMNLTLASCLIALGTSFELPLSTTYVTFMVSMGTSLADRAWGRESAVYRIAGVFTVIGGWFLTAFIALSVSMIFAFIIDWGGIIAVVLLFLFSIYVLYRTFAHHRKTEIANSLRKEEDGDILGICNQHTRRILNYIPELLKDTVEAIYTGDRKNIKQLQMKINLLLLDTKNRKNHFTVNLRNLEEDSLECGQFYLQMLHYIREFSHSTEYFVNAAHEHIMNNHRCIIEEQYEELCVLHKGVEQIFSSVAGAIDTQDFKEKEKIKRSQEKMLDLISSYQINQVRRVKNGQTNTRNTMLYMTLLYGIRDILVHLVRLLKVQSKYYR